MYYVVYPLLYLFSLLPFRILYVLSDGIFFLVFYGIKYRREVVLQNLAIAFPEKTEKERFRIAARFYRNLVDAFIESVKFISLTPRAAYKRSSADVEIINQLLANGYNVHAMACHQFNWEYANILYPLNLTAPFVGVYMPIRNKVLDRVFYQFRKRHGTVLISATAFREQTHTIFDKHYVLALAADQNPGHPGNAYWLDFFGKPAPFICGPAKAAVKNQTAVVMIGFVKRKRGHYHFNCKMITENAAQFSPEELTALYRDEVERVIRQDPANYLWSHRRWKYEWKPEYRDIIKQAAG